MRQTSGTGKSPGEKMTLIIYQWDLIQIVYSYQGYPQHWYHEYLIRVAFVCHKRNLIKGSWGYPVSFTRHLFGSTPNASKAMTDLGHGRRLLLRALCSHSCRLLVGRYTTKSASWSSAARHKPLGIPNLLRRSVTCVQIFMGHLLMHGPVTDICRKSDFPSHIFIYQQTHKTV